MGNNRGGVLLCSLGTSLRVGDIHECIFRDPCSWTSDADGPQAYAWQQLATCVTLNMLITISAPGSSGKELAVPVRNGELRQDSLPSFNGAKLDGLVKGTMCSSWKTCVTLQHMGNPCIWGNVLHILKKQKLHFFFVGWNNHYRTNFLLSGTKCYFWILIRIKKKCC